MDKLLEVAEREVKIEFELGKKCGTKICLRNLCLTSAVAFKVQTTSPKKFCVNPADGFIAAGCHVHIQILLTPQREIPLQFPRGNDKFLVLAAAADDCSAQKENLNQWFCSNKELVRATKLRVIYIGNMLLHHVVKIGDLRKTIAILKRQSSGNKADLEGQSILHTASASGKLDIAKYLLGFGSTADLSSIRDKADLMAPCLGYLESRDLQGRTPLHVAVAEGHLDIVRCLLEKGANKNARCSDGKTSLFLACAKGYEQIVNLLLNSGANRNLVDSSGLSPYQIAEINRHEAVLDVLERGNGLLTASKQGNIKRVCQYISKGHAIDCRDQFGWTPLHRAAFKGHTEVVKQLLASGANPNCKDMEGQTPLHCAVEAGHRDIMQLLIEHRFGNASPTDLKYHNIIDILLSIEVDDPSSGTIAMSSNRCSEASAEGANQSEGSVILVT